LIAAPPVIRTSKGAGNHVVVGQLLVAQELAHVLVGQFARRPVAEVSPGQRGCGVARHLEGVGLGPNRLEDERRGAGDHLGGLLGRRHLVIDVHLFLEAVQHDGHVGFASAVAGRHAQEANLAREINVAGGHVYLAAHGSILDEVLIGPHGAGRKAEVDAECEPQVRP
jgi:hypothetical protein